MRRIKSSEERKGDETVAITRAFVDPASREIYRHVLERAAPRGLAAPSTAGTSMAAGRAGKARTKTASPPARARKSGKPSGSESSLEQRLAVTERERDAFRKELATLETRLRTIEQTQAQVRDRLAIALDSLREILDGKS
jgi:hypothetical protein